VIATRGQVRGRSGEVKAEVLIAIYEIAERGRLRQNPGIV
jgi:hypothetical protein